jgi:hypothetical protein
MMNMMKIAEAVRANPHLYDPVGVADRLLEAAVGDLKEETKKETRERSAS